jgi:F-type H+-transporting ATPase subunit delta
MNDSKISVRYAKALFELALEKGKLADIEADMRLILEVSSLDDFRALLANPVLLPSKKEKVFDIAFKGALSSMSFSLIRQVLRNGREQYLPAIARNFVSSSVKHRGITQASLTTAVKASDKVKKDIIKMVSEQFNTEVVLREVVKKDIIGGFILRVDDTLIDASAKNRLRKIRKAITNK